MANVKWNPATGTWSTAADWFISTVPGALPGPADSATIDQNGSGVYTLSEDTTALISALTVASANATLAFDTALRTLTVTNAVALSAGTINISTSGTLAAGTFAETSNGQFIESAGALIVTGAGATAFSVAGNGTSFNLSGGAVTVTNGASLAGHTDTISGGTFNAGSLTVGGLTTLSGGTLTSVGATTLSNGTFLIRSTGTLSTASLAVSGGTFTESGGHVTATGLANFTGGSDNISGGTFNAGTLTISSGGSLGLSVGSTTTINSGGGGVSIASGGHLTMSGGVLDATNGGVVDSNSIIGFGTIKGVLSGGGAVEGHNGLLDLTSNIGIATGLVFQIDGGSLSQMQLDGTVGSGNTFDFLTAGGVLDYNNATKGINENITRLNVGTSKTNPTSFIDFKQYTVAVTGSNSGSGTAGTISLSDGSTLHLTGLVGNTGGNWFVNTKSDGGTGTDIFLSTVVCYAVGTRILTVTGEQTVESLMQGDIVLTLSGDELIPQPVKWIGRRQIDLAAHPHPETVAPIRIRRGAFADNMPHSDLLVSPDHAIFVDGKLICARQLINGTTIRQEKNWTAVEYFHVELESHAILLAEGLPAESYLDTGNQGFFANSGAPLVLHPDLTDETDYPTREAASCAPFVSDEAGVLPVWQRLAVRAVALGQQAPKLDTTGDPELHIVAKGRRVRPLYGENGLYIFALPKGATEVRMISRAGSPTDARPWLDDRRRLGVCVERIVLRDASDVREVPVDHPGLSQGWWALEHEGTALRRWTNGDALLPLPTLVGPTMLEIRASNGGMAYLADAEQEQRAA